MWPILANGVAWSVCRSVCHDREPCKIGWTDRDAVWDVDSGGHKEACTRGVDIGATWRIRLKRPCAAVMRLHFKLLWPLVLSCRCWPTSRKQSTELLILINMKTTSHVYTVKRKFRSSKPTRSGTFSDSRPNRSAMLQPALWHRNRHDAQLNV